MLTAMGSMARLTEALRPAARALARFAQAINGNPRLKRIARRANRRRLNRLLREQARTRKATA